MKIERNGSKWAGEAPDTFEQLLEVLKVETLDPRFEESGRFMYVNPDGVTWRAFGNFYTVSHVFNIDGTPQELEPLALAIEAASKP